jgi:hypothetical protein
MRAALIVLGLALGACGGGTPEPEVPDDSDELYEDDPVAQNFAGDGTSDKADEGEPEGLDEADAPGGPATPEDIQAILQLVIADDALDPYLKLEEPGRFPLKISGGDIPSGIALEKNTKPVEVVAAPGSDKEAVLVFTSIDADAKQARVKYRWDIEGVRGSASVKKLDGRWQLSSSRVTEY